MNILQLELAEDIPVFYVQADKFPEGISDCFNKLNDIVGPLAKRKLYGITACLDDKLVYRACVNEFIEGEGEKYALPSWKIPKGKYNYTVLQNWSENLAGVSQLFVELMKMPGVKKQTICLEEYTADGNMMAMVQQA